MANSILLFFVSYFLVVFVALLGFFWQDERFFWLAGINLVSLIIFFAISYLVKKQENKIKGTSDTEKEEKIRSNQFVKYPYIKHEKKWKKLAWYLLFVSMFLFLFSVLDLAVFHIIWNAIWIFPLAYLLLLFILWKDLIDNKIKIFWLVFDFYLFLFVSSIIVWILVYWTLVFNILPVLLLSASLISFFFFFVWYLFIKSQWIRFFFGLLYSKIYFIVILAVLMWSLLVMPYNKSIWEVFSDISVKISSFFSSVFEKENKDHLLYIWNWSVIGSGTSIIDTWMQISTWEISTWELDQYILEETWHIVVSWINPVFTSEEEVVVDTWTKEKDSVKILKEELWIKDSDSVSMIDALRYLMEANKIILSTKTNTKFTYISSTNPFYTYRKTAYDKSMIGASTNPSTKITCETYQVFKWMLLWWNLQYTSVNVKKVFWTEAEKQWVLNGCVYGKILKGENL